MIASVMTTRRAGRPIDFHIPTRLKSIGGTSSGMASELSLAVKGGRTYTGGPSLSTRPAGPHAFLFCRGRSDDRRDRPPFRLLDCPQHIMKSARAPNDARLPRGLLAAGGSRGGANHRRDLRPHH